MNGRILPRLSSSVFLVLLLFLISCKRSHKASDTGYTSQTKVYHCENGTNLNSIFINLLPGSDVKIILDSSAEYSIDALEYQGGKIEIVGNRSIIRIKDSTEGRFMMRFVDPEVLKVSNVIFDGNYEAADLDDYLIKVHTPSNRTGKVSFEGCVFRNSDSGALMIQNNFPPLHINWDAGADTISIVSCIFDNVGLYEGLHVRGSHRVVLMEKCFGTDPLGRQHYSKGKMFSFSAEVKEDRDEVHSVQIRNCRIKNANKGLFVQKVRNLKVQSFHIDSLGHNPVHYEDGREVGVVGIKIDDLGFGNIATLDSFVMSSTANLDYKVALSLEESSNIGHTSNVTLTNFNTDATIRLGAAGRNMVANGLIQESSIDVLSADNEIKNVTFTSTSRSSGIRCFQSRNYIHDCLFLRSNVFIFRKAKDNILENCHLRDSGGVRRFIVVDLNNPDNPVSLTIRNCSVPEGVLGVWSGGNPDQSTGLSLDIVDSPTMIEHDYIRRYGKVRRM